MPSTRGVPSKPPPPESHTSSSSLSSATRLDRTTRVNNQKSATPRSQSSEDISAPPRRSQRSHPTQSTDSPPKEPGDGEEDLVEEEEITRCICGSQDYPGPPQSEAFASLQDVQSEDAGGLFIQCDQCLVWQHGGCVGIVEESQSPDKYYCDECRPKLHQLQLDPRGQRYSVYLPLYPKTQRKSSMSKHDDKAKKERETSVSRASVDPSTGKRRATMRSKEHDDEEEQLKRAIEESKREVEPLGSAISGRKGGKRSREESEDSQPDIKRPRTASESLPPPAQPTPIEGEDPDDDPSSTNKHKKVKAEAAQSARQAEQRERDKERDKARAEAAGRRQERAGRRRGDETDPLEESTPKPSSADASPPPSSQPSTPPPPSEKIPHRKGASKRAKKLGNNQYTKARAEASTSTPSGRKGSGSIDDGTEHPTKEDSNGGGSNGNTEDGAKASPRVSLPPDASTANPIINGNGSSRGRFGKGKKGIGNGYNAKITPDEVEKTFVNMKGALDAMSAFISKQQLEPVGIGDSNRPALLASAADLAGADAFFAGGAVQSPSLTAAKLDADRSFDDLNSTEMAELLKKGIAAWNEQWGNMA